MWIISGILSDVNKIFTKSSKRADFFIKTQLKDKEAKHITFSYFSACNKIKNEKIAYSASESDTFLLIID